jgi:large repetitive protein
MKHFLSQTLVAVMLCAFLFNASNSAVAQTVFNPNDVNVEYNAQNPPVQPVSGPGKWVKTSRMSWNTSSFKCYIYKGIAFRLKYPKTFVPGNGIKYPLFVFFHGAGESGTIYDNEYQLYHGGFMHGAAVDNGQFDGFLLYPQCTNAIFSVPELTTVTELIEQYLIPEAQVDPFRIIGNGLSGGGAATWGTFARNPKLFAASLPISNAEYNYSSYIKANKFNPIWLFQGALDNNPPAYRGEAVRDSAKANGTNFTYTEYPTRGHDCWYQAWGEPDYFPFLSRAHKANPWPENGRTEFCPLESINQLIGVTKGFDGYQWRKDGVIISGADTNTIRATNLGTYDCRVKRGTEWSPWSPIPVVLKIKTVTVSPDPQLGTFSSKVLPAPDGSTKVQLKVAEGYAAYKWNAIGSTTALSTTNTYMAAAGSYQVTTTENFGCQSNASNAFTVINANGPNKPEAVKGLVVSKLTKTSLKLNWITNTASVNPATNFEIYQATKTGGPYQFVGITGAAEKTFTKVELTPGIKYFYIVRAVNNTAAADNSAEASASTDVDNQSPTAPINLQVSGTTRNAIALQWDAASDDVGVVRYDIYVNGVKTYASINTNFVVYNLIYNTLYNIAVKAVDLANNESPFSNQVSARPAMKGLTYKYFIGEWDKLPDFNVVAPQATGFVPNVTLANRTQEENFAFIWEGFIRIPVGGSYTFRTNSDDGSRLYLNTPYRYSAVPLVDNDNTHGGQNRDGTITLTEGVYPIAITFFQKGGGYGMSVSWKTPGNTTFVTIPDDAFTEGTVAPVNVPAAPSALVPTAVSYKKVGVTWTDNSNNETAFELFRSTDPVNNFATIAVLPANTTSYQDSTVAASTKYYYKIRAINQNGESAYDRPGKGVDYAYYETNALSVLPDFTTLTPVKTGRSDNFSLGMQQRSDNFALKFDGYLNVPSTGNYRFYTSSDDGSKLYINGNQVVNNDGLHGTGEQSSGNILLTAGVPVPISVTFFENAGGEVLEVRYQRVSGGVSKQIIPGSVLGQEYANVTTPDAPPAPAAPSGLQMVTATASSAKIAWINNALNATGFEVYRSYGNNEDYVLTATVPVANTFYTDTALFPNATVYYKVKAVGIASTSDFSNEINVVTPGVVPVLDIIEKQYMRHSSQLKVYVNASTSTTDVLTLQVLNLPAFASFATTGNGKGVITFNPGAGNQGTYAGIKAIVSNPQNNSSTRTFTLVVNDDYVPVVTGTASITLNENQTQQVTFNASDDDAGDVLNWSFIGLPGFVTVIPDNRSAQLNVAPVSGSAGTYNVIAMAEDGRNGKDTMAFTIKINTVAVSSVYINLSASSAYAPGGIWNSTNKVLGPNELFPASTSPGFKDQNGVATNVRMSINFEAGLSTVANYSGMNTGSNSGIYPDKVLQAGYKFGWDKTYAVTISGLNVNKQYSFTFLGSFNTTSNLDVSTKYTIGTSSVSLNAVRNTQNAVTISNIIPTADGKAVINIARTTTNSSAYYYINSVIVSDGVVSLNTPPAKVNDFQVKYENGFGKLTWTNTTAVVSANEVYRASALAGPYTLLNPGVNNSTEQQFIDTTVEGSKTYFYFVKAKNIYGSANTAVLKLVIPNKAPVIAANEVFIKTGQAVDVNIQATDDPADVITLKATNLPSFASFTDNGNGTGKIHLTPAAGNIGVFNATITATDNYGEAASAAMKIYVSDASVSSVYVNFNLSIPVTGIWNSFNKTAAAGASISGLKNDAGTATAIGVTLVNAWTTSGATGTVSGNNSGAYRDDVLQTFYSETSTAVKTVRITGLSTDPNVRYNLVFMSSVLATDDRTTVFSVGAKTASVNAANNTQNTVQLNDITANAGVIEYTVAKGGTSVGAYMNALVIQSYTTSTTLLAPDNFKGMGTAKNAIKLVWNNRVDGGNIEVYRSLSANGTFNLVTTVSDNTFTDTDGGSGLQSNTEYFYKLKAVLGANVSDFSRTISASTYAYSVFINFNRDNPAALPWNNTNTDPVSGAIYSSLLNDQNNYSGIIMTVGDGFSSTNASGENTGNNSGVVPDNVMRSTWWADIGQSAQLKFSGLSQNVSYSFTFFASRTAADTRITNYIINGKVVKLKVNSNRTLTVTMDNVYADINGEVVLTIQAENISTQFAYIGGLIISGAKKPSDPIDGAGGAVFRSSNATSGTGNAVTTSALSSASKLNVYPNPFRDELMVKLNLVNNVSKLVIKVTDVSGRTVLTRAYTNVSKGNWLQPVGLNDKKIAPGIYFIQIQGLSDENLTPLRVLKTK